MKCKNEEKKNAFTIIKTLSEQGFDAWLVGGAARDMILQKNPEDYDIVTNCPYQTLRRIFKNRKVKTVGVQFPVCLVDGIEVSTYRKGMDHSNSLSPTLYEDLSRRDLTINALAFNPLTGEHVDFFGGVEDLKSGQIRFTEDPGARIMEDPLRMVRACRFKGAFEGRFHEETFSAIREFKTLLPTNVALERLRLEILKAMKLKTPSLFFDALRQTDLLQFIFPSLCASVDMDGGPFHGETVWEHALLTGDALSPKYPLLRLAGFLHDIGKPFSITITEGKTSFAGHEETSAEQAACELDHLKFSHIERDFVVNLIRLHMRDITQESTPKAVRRFIKTLRDHEVLISDWLRLKIADRKANLKKENFRLSEIKAILNKIAAETSLKGLNGAFQLKDLAINGHDVIAITGTLPGKTVGQLLEKILDRVIDDPELNTRDQLIRLIEEENSLKGFE